MTVAVLVLGLLGPGVGETGGVEPVEESVIVVVRGGLIGSGTAGRGE